MNSTGLMQFETRVRIAYILLGVTYLATALSILLSCRPMHMFWQINPDPGSKFSYSNLEGRQELTQESIDICQPTVSKVYILVVVVLNVFTDVFLLFIPLPVSSTSIFYPFRNQSFLIIGSMTQLLWKVEIGLKRKISLMVLFSGGIFIIAASIIRAAVVLSVR